MTIFITGIAVVSIALGAAGAMWAQDYWRQRKAPRELKPILDWRPTLRMDARATAEAELSEDDNAPANWTLQTEEIRLIERVGGYPHVEIRWCPATCREVRDFVSTYRRIRADPGGERRLLVAGEQLALRLALGSYENRGVSERMRRQIR